MTPEYLSQIQAPNGTKIVAFLIITPVLLALYTIVRDFLGTFHERPVHFLPFNWSRTLWNPKIDVPLLEVEQNGSITEALARGSESVITQGHRSPRCEAEHCVLASPRAVQNIT